jgi:hypothetical protein
MIYGWKDLSCIWFILAGVLLSDGLKLSAQTLPSKEYQVKAVFLFNFAQFVEWPTNAFSDAHSPLVIGVLGDDPFGNFLDETVRGETVDNHPLVVRRYRHVDEINECHILFVSQSESKQLKEIFSKLNGRAILTVGDFEDFAKDGGIIRFLNENNKIRFRINLDSAKAANLTISSKLLRLAEIIESKKN